MICDLISHLDGCIDPQCFATHEQRLTKVEITGTTPFVHVLWMRRVPAHLKDFKVIMSFRPSVSIYALTSCLLHRDLHHKWLHLISVGSCITTYNTLALNFGLECTLLAHVAIQLHIILNYTCSISTLALFSTLGVSLLYIQGLNLSRELLSCTFRCCNLMPHSKLLHKVDLSTEQSHGFIYHRDFLQCKDERLTLCLCSSWLCGWRSVPNPSGYTSWHIKSRTND